MVKIVTDTGSGLTLAQAKEWGVAAMPASYVLFGDESFRETYDISIVDFHARMKSDSRFPTTSGATYDDFMTAYAPIKDQGVVSIHMPRGLSVTVESARMAAKEMLTDYAVIDSQFISTAQALFVREALRLAADGASVAQIKSHIEALIPRTRLYIVFETLENLRRGGRIGGAKALFGGMMQVKPILALKEGRLEPVEQVRTMAKAVARLKELAMKDIKSSASPLVGFMHVRAEDAVKTLAAEVCSELKLGEPFITEAGAAVSAHAGPGALGIAYIM